MSSHTVWKVRGEPTGLTFRSSPSPKTRAYVHFVAGYGWHHVARAAAASAAMIGHGWELVATRANANGSLEWWLGAPQ